MTDLQSRIASTLSRHQFDRVDGSCVCETTSGVSGFVRMGLGEFYTHQAGVVMAELGLTEETAFEYTHLASGRSTIIGPTSSDVRVARKIAGETHALTEVSRYVTGWEKEL